MREDNLRTVYGALMSSRIDFRVRIWETIRTAAVLATGTLAAIGGLLASGRVPQQLFPAVGVSLIIIGLCLAWWTFVNVKRESALQYHDEFPLYQIERELGLHEVIPEGMRWKPDAQYMFGRKHLSWQYGYAQPGSPKPDPVEDWVQGRLRQHQFLNFVIVGFGGILLLPMVVVAFILFLF